MKKTANALTKAIKYLSLALLVIFMTSCSKNSDLSTSSPSPPFLPEPVVIVTADTALFGESAKVYLESNAKSIYLIEGNNRTLVEGRTVTINGMKKDSTVVFEGINSNATQTKKVTVQYTVKCYSEKTTKLYYIGWHKMVSGALVLSGQENLPNPPWNPIHVTCSKLRFLPNTSGGYNAEVIMQDCGSTVEYPGWSRWKWYGTGETQIDFGANAAGSGNDVWGVEIHTDGKGYDRWQTKNGYHTRQVFRSI